MIKYNYRIAYRLSDNGFCKAAEGQTYQATVDNWSGSRNFYLNILKNEDALHKYFTEASMEPLRTLLVIDDSQTILDLMVNFLTLKNYNVLTAINGFEGLKLIESQNQQIDLVITDMVMPDISGVGIISIIKKKYPGIPVIAITGLGEQPEILAAEAQADKVMKKPFDLNQLSKTVTDLLSAQNT